MGKYQLIASIFIFVLIIFGIVKAIGLLFKSGKKPEDIAKESIKRQENGEK